MVPVPLATRNSQSTRLAYILLSVSTQYVHRFFRFTFGDASSHDYSQSDSLLLRRDDAPDRHSAKFIVFACLIPVLVLLSGLFAGLTLGYMSLDETQLTVLSISGTPEQRKYAKKIMPIRKNGHLLLVTLLLANMIVNESLPVIADPVLGGGVQGVIVSTALIVIFAEIIPQSLFTRHGLYLGAKMASFTQILIYFLGIISWPVAKLLEFALGPHHGIIYRRAELKELIAMHSSLGTHGGDLKTDTVTIIGATLDLQEKVVKQAMTPIENVFMLSINSKLDYDLLKRICQTGHSRVPVYDEVEVPMRAILGPEGSAYYENKDQRTVKVKKIVGILLVKQCVLLDPKGDMVDATPLRKIPLNKVPFVPNNEPLLGILDKFQDGGSHMAIVSRHSVERAASMKKAVKRGLTQRLRARVKFGDTDSDTESEEEEKTVNAGHKKRKRGKFMSALRLKESDENIDDEAKMEKTEDGIPMISLSEDGTNKILGHDEKQTEDEAAKKEEGKKPKTHGFQLPKLASGMTSMSMLEQSMPADAVLTKKSAAEFLQGWDPAVMPLGIITLEDVLEELIGEEIYDEFDNQGVHGESYGVPTNIQETTEDKAVPNAVPVSRPESREGRQGKIPGLMNLGFFRTRSAPPVARAKRAASSGPTLGDDTFAVGGGGSDKDESPTILMPRPVSGTMGRNPPSIILEQHSTISSTETGVSGTLASGDVSVLGDGDGRQQLPGSWTPSTTSQLIVAGAKPVTTPHGPAVLATAKGNSNISNNTPVPTLEALLLDRKRRLAAHAAVSGSSSLSTASSSGGAGGGSHNTPGAGGGGGGGGGGVHPPILQKDFAFSSNASTSAIKLSRSNSDYSAPGSRARSPAVVGAAGAGAGSAGGGGGAGKGTKFKSSPLGGGSRMGDVIAERVGAAYGSNGRQTAAAE